MSEQRKRKPRTRANGLGSVYWDARSKRWIAQFPVKRNITEDKKVWWSYKRQSFAKRTDALKAVQQLGEQKNQRPNFTVAYYYNSFMKGKGANLSANKKTAYKIAYNRLESLWETPVKDLTVADLQTIINDTCESHYPALDVRTLLNTIFANAVADDRMINASLPSLLELPPLEEIQVEPFTEDEVLKFWYSYESGNMNAAIPLILIYSGMMTGELRKLTKDMIHLEDKYIGKDVGLKTKERKKKTVLLPDDIIPVLEDVVSTAEKDLLYPYCKEKFYKLYYQALEDAGITRRLSPYSCRHTTATVLAVHENVAPQVLQRVMRWKSTKMMDRYVTPNDSDARKAVNKI